MRHLFLTASAAIACGMPIGAAHAQEAPRSAATARSFNIPAQSLATALQEFTEQSGVQVGYTAALGAGVQSPGVSGNFVAAEALSRLLTGTGLTFRWTSPNAVVLERAPTADASAVQLGPVRVQGDDSSYFAVGAEASAWSPVAGYVAKRTATATKIDTPLVATPQVVNVVSADQIGAIGAQTMGQALRYTPGVYTERAGSVVTGDNITIRGFTARTYLDGVRLPNGDITGPQIDPYVYPDEFHVKWQPIHRRAVYERNLDWFSFWLQDREDPDATKTAQYRRWRAMRSGVQPSPEPVPVR